MVTQVGCWSHILLEIIPGKMQFPRQMCATLALPPPCWALFVVSAAAGSTAPQVNMSCSWQSTMLKQKEEEKYHHLPEVRQGSWLLQVTFSNNLQCHTTTTSIPPAHHKGAPRPEGGLVLCLYKYAATATSCSPMIQPNSSQAPAELLLPGTSEHFTRSMKSTHECKEPANSNLPFSLSYAILLSPFNLQEGFCQHSNLRWSALLTYHILSDIIIWFLEGITPNLVLSRVSQTATTIDILSWIILYGVGFAVYCRTFSSIPGFYQ